MKHLLYSLALLFFVALCAAPTHQVAQAAGDTLLVLATPAGNLNNVINGDTLVGGLRAHPDRVYKLRCGNVYNVTEPIKVNGDLHMCSNDSTNGGAPVRPPTLAPAILPDNSTIDHFFEFVGKGAKVTLNNLYLLSVTSEQKFVGWSAGLRIQADSVNVNLRKIIFDSFTEAGIRIYAQWTKLDVQDCKFRNHMHPSSWFGGQSYMTDAPNHLDTVKFINNTFFSNNSYLFSVRGYDKMSIFDHNTLVYGTVNPFLTRQGSNLKIRNNLFYAMHAMGGNPDHVWGSWFLNWSDTVSSAIIQIRGQMNYNGQAVAGSEAYVDSAHGVFANMVTNGTRHIDVQNNDYCWPSKMASFYQAYNDTVQIYDSIDYQISGGKGWVKRILIPPTFINGIGLATLDTIAAAGGLAAYGGNLTLDPQFSNTNVNNQMDKLIEYVHKISVGKLDTVAWHFKPTGNLYPPVWPLPEDLAYSNASLMTAGKDGFPIGDLNWFPVKKAEWLLTDVKRIDPLPQEYNLAQNFPNPFNPSTTIQFTIPKNAVVKLVVYNMLGQKVRTIVNQEMEAGTFTASWDGRNDAGNQLSSGAYFYRIETKDFAKTMTMLLLK